MDKLKVDEFWSSRTGVSDRRLATNYRDDGRLDYDVALVRKYLSAGAKVLDLGAGTCTLSERLLPYGCEIDAIEKFQGFLDKAVTHPNLRKVSCDVVDFVPDRKYDAILLFGVVNFLSAEEEFALYKKCAAALSKNGTFLIKNQCGVDREKIVDGYSEELGAVYHARYPAVELQKSVLSKFFEVEVVDIYPAEMNRWEDTHFYAFICSL